MSLDKKGRRGFGAALLLGVMLAIMAATPTVAQYPVFYVCIVNETNTYINYSTEWCTRAGYNCSPVRNWSLAPGNTMTHWGSPGNGRMDIRIHTGGSGGMWANYSFYGSEDSCDGSSTHYIRYNDQGYLRLYH